MNDEIAGRIICGAIRVKPNIREFRGNCVVFDDGSKVEDVDAVGFKVWGYEDRNVSIDSCSLQVVFSTGYTFSFPFVENGNLIRVEHKQLLAYKHIFPENSADHNTLGVIGFVAVI